MNRLKYKGYSGSVNYSEPDKVFFGKIEGIEGLVNYEGESVKELTAAFHEAVNDYIIFCEDNGIKPDKSYTGTFNVRIAPATHKEIASIAAEESISINSFVKKALAEAVNNFYLSKSNKVISKRYPTPSENEVIALQEPKAGYGSKEVLRVTIPSKDFSFAKELFERLGWSLL